MHILGINTASSRTEICLVEKSESSGTINQINSWRSQNSEAEKLMPEIKQMLDTEGLDFSNLSKVVVVKGPGSFTGLRVGITVANTISYLNKCELETITTFQYLWERYQQVYGDTDSHIGLLVYAGKLGVYLSHLDDDGISDEGRLINLEDLNEELEKCGISRVFGDITEAQKETITAAGFIEVEQNLAEVIAHSSEKAFKTEKIVQPLYVKDPGITQSKKQPLT